MQQAITTDEAPTPVGPYSVGIATESLVFCSAQAGLDPRSGTLAPGGIGPETEQTLRNLEAVLGAAGLTLQNVVRSTIYLADMDDFGVVNEIYGRRMVEPLPARTTVGVAALPLGARIEIEMTAIRG
jgi:2-iminobutanoate/2-iminopropanoate deaminase